MLPQSLTPLLVLCLLTTPLVNSWSEQAQKDRVQQLEGYLNFTGKFQMFSGYLTIQAEPLINIHYLFVTSTNNSLTDDTVLWLNGGPGCSSLLGFSQEIGPNMLYSGDTNFATNFNPYSWNQKANLLFFESPSGVGFSINKDPNYIYSDPRTATDSVEAIKVWYQRFPELLGNNFWITGESYCGMYIPSFASTLLDAKTQIKFKGVMIGNGVMVTDKHWRRQARNKFYSKHYFYGTETDNLINYCQYDDTDLRNPSCIKGNQIADNDVVNINPYATIGICYTPQNSDLNLGSYLASRIGKRRFSYTPFFQQNNPIITQLNAGNYTPCTDDSGMYNYFNKATVKQQLHVDASVEWQPCNDKIGDTFKKDAETIHLFEQLKAAKIRILLYSGNTDAVVSYVETQEYIKKIGWKQLVEQKAVDNDRDSLMYWVTQYDGLTLAVINGAGHMVPSDKPHAAYEMFKEFIQRK